MFGWLCVDWLRFVVLLAVVSPLALSMIIVDMYVVPWTSVSINLVDNGLMGSWMCVCAECWWYSCVEVVLNCFVSCREFSCIFPDADSALMRLNWWFDDKLFIHVRVHITSVSLFQIVEHTTSSYDKICWSVGVLFSYMGMLSVEWRMMSFRVSCFTTNLMTVSFVWTSMFSPCFGWLRMFQVHKTGR